MISGSHGYVTRKLISLTDTVTKAKKGTLTVTVTCFNKKLVTSTATTERVAPLRIHSSMNDVRNNSSQKRKGNITFSENAGPRAFYISV